MTAHEPDRTFGYNKSIGGSHVWTALLSIDTTRQKTGALDWYRAEADIAMIRKPLIVELVGSIADTQLDQRC